jgi:hypothetical protein
MDVDWLWGLTWLFCMFPLTLFKAKNSLGGGREGKMVAVGETGLFWAEATPLGSGGFVLGEE